MMESYLANYWNKIYGRVKDANSVDTFKVRLEQFKNDTIASGVSSLGHFWELSEILLCKVNSDHQAHSDLMSANPTLAKYKGIDINPAIY